MSGYSTYWRTTIFASIAFHFLMALGFSYVLPHLIPEPTIEDVAEFEWVDVDLLPPDVVVIEAEAIPAETVQETLPTFNAQDLFVPDLTIPEPVFVEETPPPKPPEIKIVEPPKPQPPPQVVRNEQEAKQQVEAEPEKEVVVVQGKQQLGQPPVTITEFYPEKGSGLGYKGYVSIAATIGKDGKVKATKVMRTSGRYFVDEIARKAAMQWTFKPALDQDGKPMECDKIITFDFKKFAEA
ncbi:MAG: TonB family protein [Selenomonadaceae bacterium]|nr:TonB family protein [Selenomonadaceae bacterium]MBR6888198.1 TonB family protein [Selenomonadaceae bacterium]